MHNIGNEGDAQEILSWVRDSGDRYDIPVCVYDGSAPEGWKYVGKGMARSVWLSPEGVAYKVEHYHKEHSGGQSGAEVTLLARAWKRTPPAMCRLPKFSSFSVGKEIVIAIEYIDGPMLCQYRGPNEHELSQLLEDLEEAFGLLDMHDENCVVDKDGYLVPVDFGC